MDERRFTKSRTATKRMVRNLLHHIPFTARVVNNKEADGPLQTSAAAGNPRGTEHRSTQTTPPLVRQSGADVRCRQGVWACWPGRVRYVSSDPEEGARSHSARTHTLLKTYKREWWSKAACTAEKRKC